MDPGLTVLIVEDDADEAFLLQRAFREHGLMHSPHIVHNGQEGIDYINSQGRFSDRERYRFPSLIILDLKMPGMDGFKVLEWIQEHPDFRVIPTIIWSASSDPRDVKHAYCLGANGYLRKPSKFEDLKSMLGRALAHWDDCLKPMTNPGAPTCSDLKGRHPFSAVH